MVEAAAILIGVSLVLSGALAFWHYRPAARAERRQRARDEHVARMLVRLNAEAERLAAAQGITYAEAVAYLRRGLIDTVRQARDGGR